MRKKWTRFLSMSLSLAMILSNNIMPATTYADTNDNESETVIYADDMAYDKTTGHFYKLSSVGTYEQVNTEAKESGGYLACISSAEENEIVTKVASVERASASSYIGLIRNAENLQEWLWADGSEVSYTNWNQGEPNSINETVAEIYDSKRNTGAGKWNDCTITLNSTGVIEYNSCIHPESQYVVKNKTLVDCEQGGYTGDVYCGFCNEKISDGEEIEARGHSEAVLDESTVKEATCTETGYSGDKICPVCDKVLEQGKVLKANGHKEAEQVRNAKKSSCYQKGYTGDKYCEVCDETLQEGKAIPKLEHEYENDVCKNCGRVNNAQVDVTYSLTKTIDCPYTVFQFTAPESGGYTFTGDSEWDSYGYLYRADKFNDSVISAGMEMYYARLKDNNASRPQLKNYWIGNDGGNNLAPKINVELTKGETYYFVFGPYSTEYGDFKLTITCVHTKTHVEGRTLENCEQGGYTGDVVCDTCGKVIENGTTVEPSEHTPGDLENARVNSCYLDGYTGDKHCTVCNMQLQQGEVIPKFEHEYENDVCKNCGRIRNVQKNKVYDTQITKDLPIQVIEYTADKDEYVSFYCSNKTGWDSYGFLFDSENYSDEMIRNELDKFFDEDEYKI